MEGAAMASDFPNLLKLPARLLVGMLSLFLKTIDRYICRELIVTFVLTIVISTFVGMLGMLGKVVQVLADGGSSRAAGQVLLYNLPKIMCYTLPIGLLVAVVLVFNRMSADNEITALRGSGVSLLQIITPVVLLAMAISGVCWYMWFDLAPEYALQGKLVVQQAAFEDPVGLIAGKSNTEVLEGFYLMHGGKIDDNKLRDVTIYIQNRETMNLEENISAEVGEFRVNPQAQSITLTLHQVTTARFDPEDPSKAPIWLSAEVLEKEISYARHSNRKPIVRREKEMQLRHLFAWIRLLHAENRDYSKHLMQLHVRAAWALSPFTFILIGIPLGLQIGRRENYAGIIGCVGVMAVYYIPMVLLGDTLPRRGNPHVCIALIWALNLGLQLAGLGMLFRKR